MGTGRELLLHGLSAGSPRQQRCLVSHALLQRVKLERLLDGHAGCVNTVSFTPTGETLISGSDDLQLVLWDWQTGKQRLKFDSGHRNNVFQARALPHTGDKTIVTCAADGHVRVCYLNESGQATKKKLAQHGGRAHKLSLTPDNPSSFLSCGEDGEVLLFDLRARAVTSENGTANTTGDDLRQVHGPLAKMLVTGERRGEVIEINAVHHNPARPWLFAVGGSDPYARVYDARRLTSSTTAGRISAASPGTRAAALIARGLPHVAKLCPQHLRSPSADPFHITCVYFSRQGELLSTYNYEDVYLFSAAGAAGQQQPLAEASPRSAPAEEEADRQDRKRKASGDAADGGSAAGLAQRDNEEQEAAGGSARKRGGAASSGGAAGSESLGDMDDVHEHFLERTLGLPSGPPQPGPRPKAAGSAAGGGGSPSESNGPRADHVVQHYTGHRNCQTVKGVSFYGASDEYVVSGSDCGHIFVWDKVTGRLLRLLKGDRYVVNCLEPHPWQPLVMATSGIENDIKIWAPTAPEPQPLDSAYVEGVVSNNQSQRQRSARRVLITPDMLLQLLATRGRMAERRQQERQQAATQTGAQQHNTGGTAPGGGQQDVTQQVLAGARAAATERNRAHSRRSGVLFEEDDDDNGLEEEFDDDEDEGEADEEAQARFIHEVVRQITGGRLRSDDSEGDNDDEPGPTEAGGGGGGGGGREREPSGGGGAMGSLRDRLLAAWQEDLAAAGLDGDAIEWDTDDSDDDSDDEEEQEEDRSDDDEDGDDEAANRGDGSASTEESSSSSEEEEEEDNMDDVGPPSAAWQRLMGARGRRDGGGGGGGQGGEGGAGGRGTGGGVEAGAADNSSDEESSDGSSSDGDEEEEDDGGHQPAGRKGGSQQQVVFGSRGRAGGGRGGKRGGR